MTSAARAGFNSWPAHPHVRRRSAWAGTFLRWASLPLRLIWFTQGARDFFHGNHVAVHVGTAVLLGYGTHNAQSPILRHKSMGNWSFLSILGRTWGDFGLREFALRRAARRCLHRVGNSVRAGCSWGLLLGLEYKEWIEVGRSRRPLGNGASARSGVAALASRARAWFVGTLISSRLAEFGIWSSTCLRCVGQRSKTSLAARRCRVGCRTSR